MQSQSQTGFDIMKNWMEQCFKIIIKDVVVLYHSQGLPFIVFMVQEVMENEWHPILSLYCFVEHYKYIKNASSLEDFLFADLILDLLELEYIFVRLLDDLDYQQNLTYMSLLFESSQLAGQLANTFNTLTQLPDLKHTINDVPSTLIKTSSRQIAIMPPNDPALPISIILYQLLKILKPSTSNYCYPLILEYQLINFHTQLILKNKMINKESLEQLTLFPALLILFNVWNKISFYIYVIKSMSFNILQETDSIVSCANSRAKLHFLQAEKSRLETIIGQMEQQIHLQRHINQELSKANGLNENEVMGSLMTQNKRLQQQYLRIKKENEQLSSTLLIHEQLMNENQQEFATSFRSFEEKIIQLRRSIQFKESYIQNMEEKYKQAQERIIVPSNNVTLLFFNEIEQLKKTISNLSFKNKELEYQNKTLLSKIEQSEKQLKLLESLSLKSKLTYEEMKNYYNIQKVRKRYSAPKKETYIPLNEKLKQLSMKKLNQAQTRQCSQYYISTVNAPTKMLLYKYIQQIQKLKDELLKLANKVAIEQESKGKILRSYIQQQRKLQQMALQLRYYKQSTKDLLDMIAYKRHNKHSVSQQKTKQERTIDKISVPKVYKEDNQNHKLWKSMKCEVKIQKIRLLQIKRKYQGFYRSFSSTLDYRTMKLDEFNKNVNRRSPYKPKERNNQRFNINQFSMMIDNPSLDNISFIQMHKGRKNFAEWKKETKKQSLLHLTVIEENIL